MKEKERKGLTLKNEERFHDLPLFPSVGDGVIEVVGEEVIGLMKGFWLMIKGEKRVME